MITTATRPAHDTVLYDGRCRFCRGQIAILRRLDVGGGLRYVSLHDPQAGRDFPEVPPEELERQMYVVDTRGRARGGVEAVRYLTRRLPLLWPLALPLHVPGSLPLWTAAYRFVARHRYAIAGQCQQDAGQNDTCRLP